MLSQPQRVRPQGWGYRLWPAKDGIHQHRPRKVLQDPNPIFRSPVLVVSSHRRECQRLAASMAILRPFVRPKDTVIGVVPDDIDSHVPHVSFESMFPADCFFRRVGLLQIDESVLRRRVYVYRGLPVFLSRQVVRDRIPRYE